MNFKPAITPALVIQCSSCAKIEIYYRSLKSKDCFESELLSTGWTINEHNAVKCGPCNWREDKPR